MKTITAPQGSAEWLAHRRCYRNASDTPVVLGVSPHKTRAQLLQELATGIEAERGEFEETVLASGHRVEALARPLVETILGEDLYPVTGLSDPWSASFDGLTLDGSTLWEHKLMNGRLREAFEQYELMPEDYRAQMEHQLLVSGASRALFTASEWTSGGKLVDVKHAWYRPDPELRSRIVAAWDQFADDVNNYTVEAPKAAPVGRVPDALPALSIQARGMITASNLDQFREQALAHIGRINRTLVSDDDFADAAKAVKWCADGEQRCDAAMDLLLGQMADVDAVRRALADVKAEFRKTRLELDRLVEAEKEARKRELVRAGHQSVLDHIAGINATLGDYAIAPPPGLLQDIGASIKGKRELSSMKAAIDKAAADAKIAASQRADRIRACAAVLVAHSDYSHLFADSVTLCTTKAPDDLQLLVNDRIAKYQAREQARQAEAAKPSEQDQMASAVAAAKSSIAATLEQFERDQAKRAESAPAPRINLGHINQLLAPLSITADVLARLGFKSQCNGPGAHHYALTDWPRICEALVRHIEAARNAKVVA